MKRYTSVLTSAAIAAAFFIPALASADTVGPITFEPSTYTVGNINGQDGWSKTGAYDVAVSNTSIPASFGTQSLRMSDSVTSGSFGDQTFSPSLTNEAGETDALNGGMSGGVRQSHFEAQFDLASVLLDLQTGMHMSVSPDRGDGARMSYLRFEDQADGIHVFFDDALNVAQTVNVGGFFNESNIATISRAPHTIKFVMDFVDGPSNDIVQIYIDGVLVHTGTSWEDYYRFATESQPDPSYVNKSRTVDSLLFRESGSNDVGNAENGFLVDNLYLQSGTPVNDQICTTVTLKSGTGSKTAGYTENTQAGPSTALLPSSYSGAFGPAFATQTVIPPWVDPATDGNFVGSGALWISTHITWPGGAGNGEGSPHVDQWRLFEDSFNLPANATGVSANLWFTADNATDVYLNGNTSPVATTNDTYTPTPVALPQYFASVFNTPLTPLVGNNTLDFVVRNWGEFVGGPVFDPNPTGLLYKATVNYCQPVLPPPPPPPTMVKIQIFKYVDGVQATAVNANSAVFPMLTTFNSPNLGNVVDISFTLSPTPWSGIGDPYEADFIGSQAGADYTAHEVTTGNDVVGASCTDGKPFALAGYSIGDTLQDAVTAGPSPAVPTFTNLQSNHFMIVWNIKCPTTGTISGQKYNDLNRNGKKDPGEPGLQGWVIKLMLDPADTIVATTTTDASGNYTFSNVAPGTYDVREKHKNGWKRMSKNPKDIVISAGSVVAGVDFGNAVKQKKENEDTDKDDNHDDQQGTYYGNHEHSNYGQDQDKKDHQQPDNNNHGGHGN